MGCSTSRLKDDAVIAIPFKKEPEVKKTDDNFHPNNDEVSEYSLRECSFIPIQTENPRRRASDDPSIFGIIQEIS